MGNDGFTTRTNGKVANKETGLALFKQALQLNPDSPVSLIDYANGLLMLEGEKKIKEATKLYQQAVASQPQDSLDRLAVALARVEGPSKKLASLGAAEDALTRPLE